MPFHPSSISPLKQKKDIRLASAWMPVLESLEERRFFSATTIQSLPFLLDFSSDRGELVDKDGQGTGFTRVQANKLGNEYQAALLDLDTTAGVLKLTTTGTSTAGSNSNNDNTLVNGLETQFDATTSGFKITTRLIGPLGYINTAADQGGITFGPDQDNWVKLVAISQSGQQYIQFYDEQTTGTTYTHSVNQLTSVGSFASINTLDLQMVGDAGAGTVTPFYSINGGAFVKINKTLVLTGAKKAAFFTSAARAGIIALQKNDLAPITVTFDSFRLDAGVPVTAQPIVTTSRPANGDIGVPRNAFIAADVQLPTPGAGVDATTMTAATVKLYRTADRSPVDGVLNTSGGGDAIVLTPSALLDPNTAYTFEVTSGLKDTSGASFAPYTATFTTGSTGGETDPSLAFEKVDLPTATGETYTGVQMGPDGKLYASTIEGLIQRFTINADGTLGSPTNITSIQTAEGGNRIIIGMVFDASGNLWVSHSQFSDITQNVADDWTGKISVLSGANYQTVKTAVINLPRSVRDHMTNQMSFGPDGALYFAQAANTAMGAPDNAWGLRNEHLLNAAILRLDVTKVGASPIDVKTDSGGTYNPYAAGAPLTIWATGVRNAYDLVWTSDGRLFAAVNGSAAGGNTPGTPAGSYSYGANQRIDFATNGAYTGPNVPALNNVQQTQTDYIQNIVKGGYYGNPNPSRGEFVLNGGNPTAGIDPNEVPSYPVGTMPDRNYRGNNTGVTSKTQGSAFAYGLNYSPDGILQYSGTAFGGALNGKLLVCDYSGGDDITVLTTDANGNVIDVARGIAGLTHFTDPLDIVENQTTGFLYVAEFGGQKLTLVRPITPGANVSTDQSQLVFTDPTASGTSAPQTITITNTGTSALAFPSDGLTLTGTDAARFAITSKPSLPLSIAPGESITVSITFAATTVDDIRTANLQIKSNDADTPIISIPLRGLGMSGAIGAGGANEPSLQQLMNLFQIPITVGDSTPLETNLNDPPAQPNDEVVMPTLLKAGNGPVTIEPLAAFGVGNATTPTFRFGYYTPGNKNDLSELLKVVGVANSQTVNPVIGGTTTFDPGDAAFGLYTYWQNFTATQSPTLYSEDALNKTYDSHSPRKLRFYPLKTAAGAVVPDAFIFAWEEYNVTYDNQDFVGIIRNVKAAPAGAEIGFENLDGTPSSTRLVFNRIQVQPPAKENANGNPNYLPPPNIVHDVSTLRIRNSGSSTLTINSLVLSDTNSWQLVSPPTTPVDIASGGFLDVKVKFIAQSGGQVNGTLTVNSNDADEPASQIQLAGWWQKINEGSPSAEPALQTVFNVFGYTTQATTGTQSLNQGGLVARVGDEVLSPYWNRGDTTLPVTVRQLNAFHTQGNTAALGWFLKGASSTTLFTHDGDEGQSFLPHTNVATVGTVGANFAMGTFSPSNTFGFKIDGESSDDTKNVQEVADGKHGHHVRFFVARDANGNVIPNTYLMAMDYSGINYDYQDNVYLITNIKPVSPPSAPTGLGATPNGDGIALNWNDNTEANLAGYNIYRSSSAGGVYTKLNAQLLSTSDYNDVTAPLNSAVFYYVTSVDNAGNESAASTTVSSTRTIDTTPPAAPKNLVATGSPTGIQLDWANNTEADLAGYNVLRSDSFGGTYAKINTTVLTSSNFFDTSAPVNATSYYRVIAIDTSNNASAAATANAMRPGSDQTAPAAPSGLSASGDTGGVSIDWADNGEADLAGYNIYRSDSQFGTYVKLNANLLVASQFDDANAPAGATSFYHVTAVDTSANESTAAATSAARPADTTAPAQPTGLALTPSSAGIALNWTDNAEPDLAGYNVYRSDAADGTFTKLNGSLLTSSSFNDTTAPQGVTSFYQVTAVDASTNESTAATGNAMRPAPDTTAPDAPAGLVATVGGSGISLDWADNIEPDLAGYNVYRSTSAGGPWTMLNANLLAASSFLDTTAPSGTSFYEVTAVDTSTNESTPATTNATRTASYTQVDIGSPTPAGSSSTINDGSDYNLTAGGADVYGTSDSFSFLYRQLSGDFDMKVRVAALSNSSTLAKAGLMARESLVANSRNVFDLVSPTGGNGHRFTYRTSTGGGSTATGTGAATYPNDWLRLARVGNTFSGYRSTDGVNWTLVGSVTVSMPNTIFFGLAAVSHNTSLATTAQFRGLAPTGSVPVDQPPATPTGLTAVGSSSGIQLDWANNSDSDLAGYNVYRSSSANGTFTKINASLLTSSDYLDTTATSGQTSFYRVVAVDAANQESTTPATASALRPAAPDTTPPANPTGVTATRTKTAVNLDWADNSEGDLAGYNVYRSSTVNGTYVKLNASLLASSAYTDTTAAANVTNFYRITAVDSSTNESSFTAFSTAGPDTIAPATPAGISAVHGSTSIVLDWSDNTETDLAGYNVYRSTSPSSGFVKITASPISASTYTDSAAPQGVTSYYRVSAVDKVGNESGFATANQIRPFSYASADIGGGIAGSTTTVTAGSAYNVSGAGDAFNNADQLRFVYRAITGDFDIKVRVNSLTSVNGAEKAGLMARESLDAGSKNVFGIAYPGSKGYRMTYRTTTNGSSVGTGSGPVAYPNTWVRLKRADSVFTTYRSTDGVNWTSIGSVTISMNATLFVGMAVTSFSTTSTATAQFRDLQ